MASNRTLSFFKVVREVDSTVLTTRHLLKYLCRVYGKVSFIAVFENIWVILANIRCSMIHDPLVICNKLPSDITMQVEDHYSD